MKLKSYFLIERQVKIIYSLKLCLFGVVEGLIKLCSIHNLHRHYPIGRQLKISSVVLSRPALMLFQISSVAASSTPAEAVTLEMIAHIRVFKLPNLKSRGELVLGFWWHISPHVAYKKQMLQGYFLARDHFHICEKFARGPAEKDEAYLTHRKVTTPWPTISFTKMILSETLHRKIFLYPLFHHKHSYTSSAFVVSRPVELVPGAHALDCVAVTTTVSDVLNTADIHFPAGQCLHYVAKSFSQSVNIECSLRCLLDLPQPCLRHLTGGQAGDVTNRTLMSVCTV